jgi:hypothetical protein
MKKSHGGKGGGGGGGGGNSADGEVMIAGLGDPTRNFFLNKDAACYALLRADIDSVVACVSPVQIAEERRMSVCRFVQQQVEAVVQNPVIMVGSFGTKLYLPDSDIDLTAFVNPRQGKQWVPELVSALVQRGMDDDSSSGSTSSTSNGGNGNGNGSTSHGAAPLHQVRNVTFVNAETKLVKCVINNVQVDVTDNKVNNVLAAAFVLALDAAVGRDHLLSRSILLIKAWCRYDALGFVQEPLLGSDRSRLSSYGLTTMVLFIFNRFDIAHPLEALAHFFTYFKAFNWKRHVLTIFGPVDIQQPAPGASSGGSSSNGSVAYGTNSNGSSNGSSTATSDPTAAVSIDGVGSGGGGGDNTNHISHLAAQAACKFTPRLPVKVIEEHHRMMIECKVASAGKLTAHSDATPPRFPARHVNLLDPLDDSNNIGRSVNQTGVMEMAVAFAAGEKFLKTIFGCLAYASHFDEDTAPWEEGQSPVLSVSSMLMMMRLLFLLLCVSVCWSVCAGAFWRWCAPSSSSLLTAHSLPDVFLFHNRHGRSFSSCFTGASTHSGAGTASDQTF